MGNILALDIGERRIGVARANTDTRIAKPLITLNNDNDFINKLADLLEQESIEQLVVGLPRGMDGQTTKQTRYVEDFIKNMHLHVPVSLQDEALTSVKAEEILRQTHKHYNKEDIDAMAATIILTDYLESSA